MHIVKATVFRTVQCISRTVYTVHLYQCPSGVHEVATGNWSIAKVLLASLYIWHSIEVLSFCYGIEPMLWFFLPCLLSCLLMLLGNFCGFLVQQPTAIVKVSVIFAQVHMKCTNYGCCNSAVIQLQYCESYVAPGKRSCKWMFLIACNCLSCF